MPIPTVPKPDLRDLNPAQLEELMLSLGEKPYRARQVLGWLYKKNVSGLECFTTLSKALRIRLGQVAGLHRYLPTREETSSDGARKLLFTLHDGLNVEAVLIPETGHHTLCVSTQVGCRMGCRFCGTSSLGLKRNLSPSEILGQILYARESVDEQRPLTNLVFMGMGEPLDNLENLTVSLELILGGHGLQMSQRKVTVSTVGLVDRLPRLAAASPAALAVSLNAPNDKLRTRLMPVNRRFPLAQLKDALKNYSLKPARRITLGYVLLGGVNDSPGHARELARWVHGLRCKVNLIPYNAHPTSSFAPPATEVVQAFQNELISRSITALIRHSRGLDISAACGQLAAQAQ